MTAPRAWRAALALLPLLAGCAHSAAPPPAAPGTASSSEPAPGVASPPAPLPADAPPGAASSPSAPAAPAPPPPALIDLAKTLGAPRYRSIHVEPRQAADSEQVKLAEQVLAPLDPATARLLRHDPQLDAAARFVATYGAELGQAPPEATVQALFTRVGATAQVRLTHLRSAEGPLAPTQLAGEWTTVASTLKGSRSAMSFGVARIPYGAEGMVQAIVIGEDRVLLDGFSRTPQAGETLTLKGRMPALYSQARAFGEGDAGMWVQGVELDVAGTFSLTYTLPQAPGTYYLEMNALFAPEGQTSASARVERQLLVPLYVGVPAPEALPPWMLTPPEDPPSGDLPERILSIYNAERRGAGLPPLSLDPVASGLAGRIAEGSSRGAPAPSSLDVARLLGNQGVPVGRLHQWNLLTDSVLLQVGENLRAPSHRRVILDPEMERLGIGVAQSGQGAQRIVEYAFGLVAPTEPGDERARVLEMVRDARTAAKLPGYLVDPLAEATIQALAQEVCDGERAPDQVDLAFPRLKEAGVPYGRGRYSWKTTVDLFNAEDLAERQAKIVETPYSHIALGACQGQVGNGPTRHYFLFVIYDLK